MIYLGDFGHNTNIGIESYDLGDNTNIGIEAYDLVDNTNIGVEKHKSTMLSFTALSY